MLISDSIYVCFNPNMLLKGSLVILSILSVAWATTLQNETESRTQKSMRSFPDDFFFGTATSSYQIEGAWNEGGKGWSMWDHLVRTAPEHIRDRTNGDVAANSYYFYEKDIAILKELGVSVYRFSVSWPRILPFGRADYVNPEGIAYYNTLIDLLLANNITPFLTIYHWELPQNLNEQGGWLTEDIVDWFGDYARVLFQHFGDRVKLWLTINEPYIHCYHGYGTGNHAPRIQSPGLKYYECGRHVLLAHARAYHIYNDEFRSSQRGSVGIGLDAQMGMPSTDSADDIKAAEDFMVFYLGQYAHPIYSETGNYPQRFIDLVAEASARQGLPESRLRNFTQEQINYIKGSADYMGLNHYTSNYVYRNASVEGLHEIPSWHDDAKLGLYRDPSWIFGAWIGTYGPGLHKLLVHIKDNYNNPTIYIAENGFASETGLNDDGRVNYYREYLNAVLDAIADGVNIKGYCAWSLMDNFEWMWGYSVRFGLYEIDQNDPEKTRKPRKSAIVYKEIVRTRSIDPDYNPDPYATDSSINTKSSFIIIGAVAIIKLMFYILSVTWAITLKNTTESRTQKSLRRFPDDFFFGTATSSYQIEGAWNEGGKGWSMWDHLVRTAPEHIRDGTNGDIAANSYYFYEKDVAILKELGVSVYRFSVSWPRILPFGRADYVNPEGIAYYNTLIDLLLANNITPFLTIYHWELPQNLNEQGGWLTEHIVDWFGDYARVLFQHFGDRVKLWLTINEPYVHCAHGYGYGNHAPRIQSPGLKYYECGRHVLLAHARAYHIYNDEFRSSQGGSIGIALDSEIGMPSSDSPDDVQAAEDFMLFYLGQYAHPIYSETGNYPQRFIELIAEASARQGLSESRLRLFTQEQIDYMKGSADYMALNHYSSSYVYRNASVVGLHEVPSLLDDAQIGTYKDPTWNFGAWIGTYGPGLHKLLVYIKDNYNNPTIYIAENGFATGTGLNDDGRVNYYRQYLNGVLDAIADGVNVKGYCAWSLMDNFEWDFGYSVRFGLYEIDQKDPEKTRKPRKSALVYKEIVRTRSIDLDYNPDPYATDSSINSKSSLIIIVAVALIKLIL